MTEPHGLDVHFGMVSGLCTRAIGGGGVGGG
jgi:hypothetical protein